MKRLSLFLCYLVAVMLACSSPAWTVEPKPTKPTATKSIPPKATATNQVAVVTAHQSLHVRVRPGEREPVAGYLYRGDPVTLTGKCQTKWAQIEWRQGGTAWVKAKYLSDNKCKE
jgi:uncharacterized protein YgiM (DUF1202 family)